MTAKLRALSASLWAMASGVARVARGRWCACAVCEHRVPAFLPWRGGWSAAPPLMRSLKMIGSDLDRFACPRCGANDRDRHLKLYLERVGFAARFHGARILHFAPEAALVGWISGFQPKLHLLADLFPARSGIQRVDVEAIPFANGSFDIVIANHVLEHVKNLAHATEEISRILAQGGVAILQTPWCAGLESTIDDAAVQDPRARLDLYGQEDHARLFGRDVYVRIAGDRLRAHPITHASVLADIDPDVYGVNPLEELMLFART